MITDEDAEKALDYLRDNAAKAAQAKAEYLYMDEYRRVVKAQIMRENDDKALGAQEAIAYADPRYREHLTALKDAAQRDEYMRWMMKAAEAKIDAWRTESSNRRAQI